MFLDGHVALRIRDVRTITFLDGASFQARALEHYGDRARRPGRVDLASTRTVIASLGRRFPLITIHPELRDPTVCYIGVPVSLTSRSLRLRAITTEAVWEDELSTYQLMDVTRVEIGGRYERALLAVGGRPTKVKRP